jgi:hypothetical protein
MEDYLTSLLRCPMSFSLESAKEHLFCVSGVNNNIDKTTLTACIRSIKIEEDDITIEFLLGNKKIWNFFADNLSALIIESIDKKGNVVSNVKYDFYDNKLTHKFFTQEFNNRAALGVFKSKFNSQAKKVN